MTTNIFENYILPISGIDFVRYNAIFSLLSEYNIKPTRIFSASGGSLSSYCAMMSNFSKSIENWNFNSQMFIRKLTPITPRLFTFLMHHFFYHRQNIDDFVNKTFLPSRLEDIEIISGFYEQGEVDSPNTTCVLTTNFPQTTSHLNTINASEYLGGNLRIDYPKPESTFSNRREFLDYLMKFCTDSIYKTSNIPYLLEPFGKERACDFGIISPSPRILAKANIKKTIYFSPINIENNKKTGYSLVFHQMIMKDILTIEQSFTSRQNFLNFQLVLDQIATIQEYCLLIYCDYNFDFLITDFDNKLINKHLRECKNRIKFVLFYN